MMNETEIKIHHVIKEKLGVDESLINNESLFNEDLGVDSLDFCEMIVSIEKELNVQIPDDDFGRLKTVGALVNYVDKKLESMYQAA